MKHSIFRLFVVAGGLGLAVPAGADDFTRLTDTKAWEQLERVTEAGRKQQRDARWNPPEKNSSRLFEDQAGGQFIHLWLDVPSDDYTEKFRGANSYTEYVRAIREYETKSKNELQLVVMVPHPRHRMKVEYDLIKEFAMLKPPMLKYGSKEEIEVQGQKGFFLESEDRQFCSLHLNLARASILHLSGRCAAREEMFKLCNELSIHRLNAKLES